MTVLAPAARAAYPPGFWSVGYQPSWSGNVGTIPYNTHTHINYAFVLPNANGTLQAIPEPGRLQQLVSLGHQNGVKVSLAVGGWNNGNDDNFEILAANANSRTTFVNALIKKGSAFPMVSAPTMMPIATPRPARNHVAAIFIAGG